MKAELDLPNYATESDFKNATGADADASDFAKKVDGKLDIGKSEKVPNDWSSLKSKVDKLDIGKLQTTRVELNKLSDVVKNNVVKKTE